jgi:proteasome lid subunit RPN8/RPN11
MEISAPIWSETIDRFRICGDGRRECVVYWVGPASIPGTITRVVHPKHTATGRYYRIDETWLTGFWLELAGTGETVRIQVHTHGGRPCHSSTDDEGALVYESGFLSLVVPGFATHDDAVERTYLAELDAQGTWHEVTVHERLQWI